MHAYQITNNTKEMETAGEDTIKKYPRRSTTPIIFNIS